MVQSGGHERASLSILRSLGLLRQGWFPNFQEFAPRIQSAITVCHGHMPNTNVADHAALGQVLYSTMVIHNAGNPTFILQPTLARMLCETDLPNDMSLDWLRLPFEGIFLDFPAGVLTGPAKDVTRLHLTFVPDDRFRVVYHPDGETTSHLSLRVTRKQLDLPIDAELPSIRDAVKATKAHGFEDIPPEEAAIMRSSQQYDDYFASDVFAFAVNAALYITSEGADLEEDRSGIHKIAAALQGEKKKAKREALEQQMRQEKEHKIYICGAKLSQSVEMHASLTEEGHRLTKRFRVRGHWRDQACGAGRLERRHIFVQPFWKGPTYAELLARNYVVQP